MDWSNKKLVQRLHKFFELDFERVFDHRAMNIQSSYSDKILSQQEKLAVTFFTTHYSASNIFKVIAD